MRRLIESLTPQARQLYWKWVGGVFALYVVLLLTAAGVFVGHESPRRLAQEPVTTMSVHGNPFDRRGRGAGAAGGAGLKASGESVAHLQAVCKSDTINTRI